MADGAPQDIISSDGEVIATMKNGAEYVLRFGNLTNVASGEKEEATRPRPGRCGGRREEGRRRRASLHVRDGPAQQGRREAARAEAVARAAGQGRGEAGRRGSAGCGSCSAAATLRRRRCRRPRPPAEGATGNAACDARRPTPRRRMQRRPTSRRTESRPRRPRLRPLPPKTRRKDEAPAAAEAPADKDKELEKIMAERKRIEDENQRKNDEYQELLKKGDEQVKELNLRFGDWYFVVDDERVQEASPRPQRRDQEERAAQDGRRSTAGATNPFPARTPRPPACRPSPAPTQQ